VPIRFTKMTVIAGRKDSRFTFVPPKGAATVPLK